MKTNLHRATAAVLTALTLAAGCAFADNKVEINSTGTTTVVTGGGNSASVTIGGIGSNAQVEGVSVINGKVFIDGKEIPPEVKRYKSKGGTIYRIERKGDSVDVRSEEGKKR